MLTYWAIYKFDVFHARTAAYVNIRGAMHAEEGPSSPTYKAAMGMVERKLLARKLQAAVVAIEHAIQRTFGIAPAATRTASLRRMSVSLAHEPSVGAHEEAVKAVQAAAAEVVPLASADDRKAVEHHMKEVHRVKDRLRTVSVASKASSRRSWWRRDEELGEGST